MIAWLKRLFRRKPKGIPITSLRFDQNCQKTGLYRISPEFVDAFNSMCGPFNTVEPAPIPERHPYPRGYCADCGQECAILRDGTAPHGSHKCHIKES